MVRCIDEPDTGGRWLWGGLYVWISRFIRRPGGAFPALALSPHSYSYPQANCFHLATRPLFLYWHGHFHCVLRKQQGPRHAGIQHGLFVKPHTALVWGNGIARFPTTRDATQQLRAYVNRRTRDAGLFYAQFVVKGTVYCTPSHFRLQDRGIQQSSRR